MDESYPERLLQYLWTSDPDAQVVIYCLFGLFVAWLIWLVWSVVRLQWEKRALLRLKELEGLANRTREHVEGVPTPEKREKVFDSFLTRKRLGKGGAVVRHVKSIFDAGWSDARLDVRELNKHTGEQLFRANTLLKPILGIFIVVGLFGTLLGLAKALAPLSGIGFSGVPSAEDADQVQQLLAKLQSAFAPSLWGVFFTIVGVVMYSVYLRYVCTPLKGILERMTLDVWVPRLYPTTSQRVLETLEEADRQAHDNLEAAQKVAEFAQGLDDEIKDFAPKVQEANKMLGDFRGALAVADEATKRLAKAMEQFSSSQENLKVTFEELNENSTQVRVLLESVSQQNEELKNGLKAIQNFEEAYAERQAKTEAALKEVTSSAKKAFELLGERNEEVLHAVGRPIVKQLRGVNKTLQEELHALKSEVERMKIPLDESAQRIEKIAAQYPENTRRLLEMVHDEVFSQLGEPIAEELAHVDETLHSRLEEVSRGLRNLQDPVQESAQRIGGIADSFVKDSRRLMSDVQGEFRRQNEENARREANLEELNDELVDLFQQQEKLIKEMQGMSKKMSRLSTTYTFAEFLRDKFLVEKNGR